MTGETRNEQQRLVVVDHDAGELEQQLLDKACIILMKWFPGNYPESKLLGVIPHATIGDDDIPVVDNRLKYTEHALVDFGKYLLSKERTDRFTNLHSEDDPIALQDRLREVYHADLGNWKAMYRGHLHH